MTELLQKIRERAAFDESEWSISADHDVTGIRCARGENARLLPLIEALIRAVEEANKALVWIERDIKFDRHEDPVIRRSAEARVSMQSILEKAVRE